MNIIEAVWEKRNLGVTAYEVKLDGDELIDEIIDKLSKIKCDYTVVRTPAGRLDFYEALTKVGFSYAETMFKLVRNVNEKVIVPSHKETVNEALKLAPMNDEEFLLMLEEVKNGLYKTDRISLDPHFTSSQAANRYYCWLQDERKNGNEFLKLTYEGKFIGYLDLKALPNNEYEIQFTGIFPQYAGKGYAIGFTTKLMEILSERNATKTYIEISSNNIQSLRAMMNHGYGISSYFYVFVRH